MRHNTAGVAWFRSMGRRAASLGIDGRLAEIVWGIRAAPRWARDEFWWAFTQQANPDLVPCGRCYTVRGAVCRSPFCGYCGFPWK